MVDMNNLTLKKPNQNKELLIITGFGVIEN